MTGPGLATAASLMVANPNWPPEMLQSWFSILQFCLPVLDQNLPTLFIPQLRPNCRSPPYFSLTCSICSPCRGVLVFLHTSLLNKLCSPVLWTFYLSVASHSLAWWIYNSCPSLIYQLSLLARIPAPDPPVQHSGSRFLPHDFSNHFKYILPLS